MLGIVVTYAIVMLQFEMDAEENRKNPATHHKSTRTPPTLSPYVYAFSAGYDLNTTEATPTIFS